MASQSGSNGCSAVNFNVFSTTQTSDKIAKAISSHYYNNAVTVLLPGSNAMPEKIQECLTEQLSYKLYGLHLHRLIEVPFIQAFVRRGCMYMLSAGTRLGTDNCVAVTPTGWLILYLTKDTYNELGLEALKQTHQQKANDNYVVKINLLAEYFKPGKKNYNSTLWCLKNRLNLVFDFYIAWTPTDVNVCSSSVSIYFTDLCQKVERCRLSLNTQVLTSLQCPKVNFDDLSGLSDDSCHFQEVFEWMGAVACGVDMSEVSENNSFASSLRCPDPSENCPRCCMLQVSGFITPGVILKIFHAIRSHVSTDPDQPPSSLTVHGFRDSPVLQDKLAHQMDTCGDNLISFLFLPENQCWLYRAVAS